jgi:hypothetical protein
MVTARIDAFLELSRELLLGVGPFQDLAIPPEWTFIRYLAEELGDRDHVHRLALEYVRQKLLHGSRGFPTDSPELGLLVGQYRPLFQEKVRARRQPVDKTHDAPSMLTVFDEIFDAQNLLRKRKKNSEEVFVYLNKDKRRHEFFARCTFPRSDPGCMSVIFGMLPLRQQGWHPGGLMGAPPPAGTVVVNPADRRPPVVADVISFTIRAMTAYRPIIDME